ncbi:MAG: hypothetical protein GDA46_07270, partial [Bdellovibrionales bacterium]|nr:hypothetical protein [Bdellovibrionales bacterium]
IWGATEKLLIEEGILTRGGLMQDVIGVIKEEGLQEGMQRGMQRGMEKGMQKGRQEGRQERDKEIVLNMLKEEVEMAFISKITGFSKEEIEKLKKNS